MSYRFTFPGLQLMVLMGFCGFLVLSKCDTATDPDDDKDTTASEQKNNSITLPPIIKPKFKAIALPREPNVAVGATHDLVVIACENRISLDKITWNIAVFTLLIQLGRLDAALYLPGALAQAAIPGCEEVRYTVTKAAIEGEAFKLEPTENQAVFHAHALKEGAATFKATVSVGGKTLSVSSELHAWVPDSLVFEPICSTNPGEVTEKGLIPENFDVTFNHRLFRGTIRLTGYGFYGLEHSRLVIKQNAKGTITGEAKTGPPFTLSSPVDKNYKLTLTPYGPEVFDSFTLKHLFNEFIFTGQKANIQSVLTAKGAVPCLWSPGSMRRLILETPNICDLENNLLNRDTLVSNHNIVWPIMGVTPGTCRIRAEHMGSDMTSTLKKEVYESFEMITKVDTLDPSYNFTDIWVVSPTEFVIVGWSSRSSSKNVIARWANGKWEWPIKDWEAWVLRAVHGSRADGSIVAVGNNGRGRIWAGEKWTSFKTGRNVTLFDVWVFNKNNVYAVGDSGVFLYWDGTNWNDIKTGTTARIRSLWGDSNGDIYLAGWNRTLLRYRKGVLKNILPDNVGDFRFGLADINATGPDDLWAISNKQVLRFNGSEWATPKLPNDPKKTLTAAQPMGDGVVYVINNGFNNTSVDRFDGSQIVPMPIFGRAEAITALDDEVYVLTRRSVYRYRHDPTVTFK